MYLVSQLWLSLILAFLLGALLGYMMWRACGRRYMQAGYDRQSREMSARITALERERGQFSSAAMEAERENARLQEALAGAVRPDKTAPAREARR